jgi:phosphopantothenoylcysteine decarboxylase/phosphopantothenate--cysteine ligase
VGARDGHLKDIQGSHGDLLAGHHIALGVSGSIAALESPALARLLMRWGAEVHCVMSPAACGILSPAALEWATGNPVLTRITGRVEHLELCGEQGKCSLYLVAPATANTLGQMATAQDSTPVTTVATTALGRGLPVLVAPGMHAPMYGHPGVQENLRRLESFGVVVIPPRLEEGKAKMAPAQDILEAVLRALGPRDLEGRRVLMTAGPTREPLDPVRFLTNPSSGRMGAELAREAWRRGAEVTVIYGPGQVEMPSSARVVRVQTAEEMGRAVEEELRRQSWDVFVAAAAVADYRPARPAASKIPTAEGERLVSLLPTPKILDRVRDLAPSCYIVGFKAETGQDARALCQAARRKLAEARADLVAANLVGCPGSGFESPTNEMWLVGPEGEPLHLERASKALQARRLWDYVARRLAGPG